MSKDQAVRLDASPDGVGESPLWDGDTGTLFWVDVVAGRVRGCELASGMVRSWDKPGLVHGTPDNPGYAGAIGLASPGKLLVALKDGLYELNTETGAVEPRCLIPDCDPNTRLNDGKMDRQGRFVCGQATLNGQPIGKLFRFSADGTIETLANSIWVTNGLCFSPNGDRMYFTDSFSRRFLVFPYSTGREVGEPSLFFDCKVVDTIADGATVDADGNVWAAMTKTGEVMMISPTGELLRKVEVPVEFPSCTAFGGDGLSTLFVTTIKDSKTGRTVSKHPDGGALYAFTNLSARGLAEARFGGAG